MKRTFPQRFLYVCGHILAGAIALDLVLGPLTNAISLISVKIALWVTIPALVTGMVLFILFRSRKIKWTDHSSGKRLNVIKFSNRVLLGFAGAFLMLWGGAIYNRLQPPPMPLHAPVAALPKPAAPLFNPTDGRFKVLILPWEQDCEYEGKKYNIGRLIQKRFDNMSRSTGNRIYARYLDSVDIKNLSPAMADSLMRYHHADQVLYGAYSFRECEGGTSDKISFNYITNFTDWHLAEIYARTEYKMHDMEGLEDIRKGAETAEMDYILNWVAAIANMKQYNFAAAVQNLRSIKGFETNESVLFQLSSCYHFMKDYTNARIYMEKVLQVNPGHIEAMIHLGTTFLNENKPREAKQYFEKVLAYCPNEVGALTNLGLAYGKLKDTLTANVYYGRAMSRLRTDNETDLTLLATIYRYMGNYEKAKVFYETALRYHDAHADSWTSLASVCLQLKDTALALDYLNRAVKVDSNYAEAWYATGNIHLKQKHYNKALPCFEKAVQINPANVDALTWLGICYYNMHNDERAVKCLDDAHAINPNAIIPLYSSFLICRNLKKYDKAKQAMEQIVKLCPDSITYLNQLGILCQQMDKYPEALVYFKRMLKMLPNNGAIYYNLANTSSCLHKKADALSYLSKAVRYEPAVKKFIAKDHSFDWLLKNKEFLAIAQ